MFVTIIYHSISKRNANLSSLSIAYWLSQYLDINQGGVTPDPLRHMNGEETLFSCIMSNSRKKDRPTLYVAFGRLRMTAGRGLRFQQIFLTLRQRTLRSGRSRSIVSDQISVIAL